MMTRLDRARGYWLLGIGVALLFLKYLFPYETHGLKVIWTQTHGGVFWGVLLASIITIEIWSAFIAGDAESDLHNFSPGHPVYIQAERKWKVCRQIFKFWGPAAMIFTVIAIIGYYT